MADAPIGAVMTMLSTAIERMAAPFGTPIPNGIAPIAAWTAEQFADALGVSYRVLNYAFREATGTSLYRYFLNERLHEERRQLNSGHKSVIDACFSQGFESPSRFARHYARLFGELPSQTMITGTRSTD